MNMHVSVAAKRSPAAFLNYYKRELNERGFTIIPNVVDPDLVARVDLDLAERFERTPFCRGNFFGDRTVRFQRALIRSKHVIDLVMNELTLGISHAVLGEESQIQLNLTQAIAVHPGAPVQLPHRDENMWPIEKREPFEYLVNVFWPLSDFTFENGATLLWPGSHRGSSIPMAAEPEVAEMKTGSALIFLGSTLHGQGANISTGIRRGLAIGYALDWLKSYENQFLAYPPEIARNFPKAVADLVGYRQLRPNLNNFEGRDPGLLLGDGPTDFLGAQDAMRPEHEEAIARYYQRTRH